MRVIAGSAKGRILKSPKGIKIRPTSDKVREAIFDILGARVPGSKVLDLFAGTGALGIEALSRDASRVLFVEKSAGCIKIIAENLKRTNFADKAIIIRADAFKKIRQFYKQVERFDIVLADPSYITPSSHKETIPIPKKTLQTLSENDILSENGLVVLEHHISFQASEYEGRLRLVSSRRYGKTGVSIFSKS